MKKLISFVAIMSCVCMFAGCYSVNIIAPPNEEIRLLAPAENVAYRKVQRNWFVLWGLVPLGSDNVPKIVREAGLTEVRVETKTTFLDGLISGVLGFVSIATNTTIVEGNTTK